MKYRPLDAELERDLARAARWLQAPAVDVDEEADAPETATLRQLRQLFSLARYELEGILLALAAELGDGTVGQPTVATLLDVIGARGAPRAELRAALAPGGHLLRCGLIELIGDGPLPTRIVRLPDTFWPRLAGMRVAARYPHEPADPGSLARLVLAPDTTARIERVLAEAARRDRLLLRISGPSGSGRGALATAIAAELGFGAIQVDATVADDPANTPHLVRETVWSRAALVISGSPTAVAVARLAAELAAPIIVLGDSAAASHRVAMGNRISIDLTIAELDLDGRERVWRQHLVDVPLAPDLDIRGLAARVIAGPGRLAAYAATARRLADGDLTIAALREVVRAATPTSGLAQRLVAHVQLDELVLPVATRRELELAIDWVKQGPTVFRPGGVGELVRGGGGLTCLFHGPPGTGKTMAAHALATAIGADVLRIDLAQVVNKYIGETEKHLAQLFDEAEATGALLFFDEADALFGKRTETKDAHDRYANVETAYLLQRLELHRGICVLATNLRHNIDSAFTRRIQVVAEFTMPTRDERRSLWERQLPALALDPDVDLRALADRIALSGGDIRNAAATAAVLAAADGGSVTMRHLVIGTWRELRKAGRLITADDFGPWKAAIVAYGR